MAWRKVIGEQWNVEKLALIMPESNWRRFVTTHEKLIYRAMMNYKDSRTELSKIIPTYI